MLCDGAEVMKSKGRPPIAKDGEKMRNRNFRATDAEWAKCLQLGGGAFLRAKINAAKVKDARAVIDRAGV